MAGTNQLGHVSICYHCWWLRTERPALLVGLQAGPYRRWRQGLPAAAGPPQAEWRCMWAGEVDLKGRWKQRNQGKGIRIRIWILESKKTAALAGGARAAGCKQ